MKSSEEQENLNTRLDRITPIVEQEIARVKSLVSSKEPVDSEDFDLRGELYRLAFEVAPEARKQDLEYLFDWLNPKEKEVGIDTSAGTGFLTIPLARMTWSRVYAIDPSNVQLENLKKKRGDLDIVTIGGPLSTEKIDTAVGEDAGKIDFVTSYGGIHHVLDKEVDGKTINIQQKMFAHFSRLLRPGGRFVAGDVGAGTSLSDHFEKSVKEHCLTGHTEKWLSAERLETELGEEVGLNLLKSEIVSVKWFFESERQMALFMKCLHAYDMSEKEVLEDLQSILGYAQNESGLYELNWPMLFFHLEKGHTV